MDSFLHILTSYVLPFIMVIGPVIFIHELGHFLAAKAVGIRVERFSIGFPPRMVGKKIGETDYCLSWLPVGGYVKMAGMIDESLDNPETITGAPDEFMSKNSAQKMLVISAGVIMNVILAAGIYVGITLFEGVPEIKEPIVDTVSPAMPADSAGMQAGDRIMAIDGQAVANWDEVIAIIHNSPGRPVRVAWERDGDRLEATITPKLSVAPVGPGGDDREIGLIGITPRPSFRPVGFFEAVGTGFQLTWANARLVVGSLWKLVSGQASVKEIGGPIAIAKMSGDVAKGGAASLTIWIALMSINIGLLNLLPIPALDGGHLAMITVEAIRRKPITSRIKMVMQQVGMVLLLVLMVLVLFQDAGRIGLFGKIKGMF